MAEKLNFQEYNNEANYVSPAEISRETSEKISRLRGRKAFGAAFFGNNL